MKYVAIESIYNCFLETGNIVTDSRLVVDNGIFFALKGANFNGNQFAKDALKNGCTFAIIDEEEWRLDEKYLLVENVLKTLQELANYHRNKLQKPIIGITGTNGKTTTKELVNCVLSSTFNTTCTKGNLNNHIGVPITLLSMTKSTEIGIIEMGANHQYEIDELCKIADPDFGIISSIGKAHLEGFGSYETIIATKSELYKHIISKNGLLFVNKEDTLLVELSENSNRKFYGNSEGVSVKGSITENSPFVSVKIEDETGSEIVCTKLIGDYNTNNILAAATVGKHFGISLSKIRGAIESYTPGNNRSQLIKTGKNVIIMDAYNANPSSMEAAISNFANITAQNKMVILGEMLELGDESQKEHSKILSLVKQHSISKIFLVGNWTNEFDNNITIFTKTSELIDYLKKQEIKNHTILIKGSRGNKLESITDL